MKHYIGIDPGQTGAIACIDEDGAILGLEQWYDGDMADGFIKELPIDFAELSAVIEDVHSMPGQGVVSSFKFGKNVGIWEGLLIAHRIKYRFVSPRLWQKGIIHKIDGVKIKDQTMAAAKRMFPTASLRKKKEHGLADALLIADWLKRQDGK